MGPLKYRIRTFLRFCESHSIEPTLQRYVKQSISWRGPFSWKDIEKRASSNEDEHIYLVVAESSTKYCGITSGSILKRFKNHHKLSKIFDGHRRQDVEFYFANPQKYKRIENAMIFTHWFPENDHMVDRWWGPGIIITHKGSFPPGIFDFKISIDYGFRPYGWIDAL